MATNEVKIRLTVEGNAKKQLESATAAIEDFGKKGKSAFSGVSGAFAVFAGNLASAAFQKGLSLLSQGIRSSATAFLEFDKAVAEVNSLLPANVKLTKETTDAFIKFSSQFGGNATRQAEAFYQTLSAGITDVNEATKLLESANIAAVAGITDVQTAVDALTNVINAFGKEEITTTEASDILFTAVKEGKTTFAELASNIGKVNTIAASAQVGFDEVAASLAFLTKSGISTEEATTSLRATIASIIKPTVDQLKAAKALGIEFNATALASKGLGGFLDEVRRVTGGNTEALAKLFPNMRALTAVTGFAGKNFAEFNRILGETASASGATGDAFAKVAESTSFQFSVLQSSIQNVGLSIFQDLEPGFKIILQAALQMSESFKNISVSMSVFIGTVDATLAAADLMSRTFSFVFNVMKSGFATVATVATGFVTGLVAVLSEVAAAIPGLENPFESLKDTLVDLSQTLLEETVGSTEAAFTAFSKHTVISDMRAEIEKATQASRDLATASVEGSEIQDELAESKVERDEILKESIESVTTAQMKLINSVIEGGKTQVEKEEDKLKALRKINAETAADKAKLANAVIKQVEKISETEKKEQDKRTSKDRDTSKKRLNAASKAFGDLAVLSNSKNKELAAIGKASAIAQTTIDTYAAAQAAYKALAGIPIIGPGLGIAAAAAAIISGLARVAQISGTPLQEGITNVPGTGTADNFPALLAPRERVVDAGTNEDLKAFLAGSAGQTEVLLDISERLENLNNQVTVNVGGETLVNELIDQQRGGRTIEVA